jgi:hypothetical protein
MRKYLYNEMLKPAIRHIGKTAGVFLAGASTVAEAGQIEAAIVLLLGAGADLLIRQMVK